MTSAEISHHEAELSVPSHVYPLRAGLIGGALGGVAMALTAMIYGAVWRGSPWLPINVVAATFLSDLQAASPDLLVQFNVSALFLGGLMHILLSLGLGVLFVLLLPTLPGTPLFWAITIGPLLWAIATVITLPLINPLGARVIDWPSFIVAHLAYGLVLGFKVVRTPKVRAG
jgi:hypothetical protein